MPSSENSYCILSQNIINEKNLLGFMVLVYRHDCHYECPINLGSLLFDLTIGGSHLKIGLAFIIRNIELSPTIFNWSSDGNIFNKKYGYLLAEPFIWRCLCSLSTWKKTLTPTSFMKCSKNYLSMKKRLKLMKLNQCCHREENGMKMNSVVTSN